MAKNVLKNPGRALKLDQTLALHLLLEALKQLYHGYQKLLIFITPEKRFTWANLYKLCYMNGPKK